jgi:multiple sugar transport system permease protein
MGALENLGDIFSSQQLLEKDFLRESLETNRFDGGLYGVPWYVDTRIAYYQPSRLKELGWEHFPRTWEEFFELGRQSMADRRQKGDSQGFYAGLQGFSFEMFYWQAGGEFNRQGNNENYFMEAPLVRALEYVRSMRQAGFYGKPRDSGLDYISEFDLGIYDVAVSGPWMAADLKRASKRLKKEWAVAVLPAKENNASFLGGSNLVLFKDSKHKAAGRKLICFLCRPDVQARWYLLSNDIPANLKAYSNAEVKNDKILPVFARQLETARVGPSGKEWTIFWERMHQRYADFEEKQSPTASEFAREMNSQMALVIKEISARKKPVFRGFWYLLAGIPALTVFLIMAFSLDRLKRVGSHQRSRVSTLFFFLLPALVILLIFRFLPLSLAFAASLTDLSAENFLAPETSNYLGLGNYTRLLQDELFAKSIRNTTFFMLCGIPLNILVALSLALIINRLKGWKKTILALGLFLPSVVTTVASAVTWKWIFCQQSPMNVFLNWLGFEPIGWLIEQELALPSLIIFSVWRSFGLSMIIILAGLTTIDKELYESVKVDGGDLFDEFLHVTLPGLRRTLFTIAIGAFVANVQFFIEPYVLTGGGPKYATLSILLYSYNQAFSSFQLGYASAIAFVLFLFFAMFNLWQSRMRKKLQ